MKIPTILLLIVLPFCLCAKPKHDKPKHKVQLDLLNELAAYWTLNQRADLDFPLHDEVGVAHLTPHNLLFNEDGVADGSTVFDGNEGYANLTPNSPVDWSTEEAREAVRMRAGQSFTILLWLRFHSLAGGIKVILGKYKNSPTQQIEYALIWNAVTEHLEFLYGNGGSGFDTAEAVTHGPVLVDTWYHVKLWHNADTDRIGISINGISDVVTTTHVGGVGSPEPEFRLGQSSDGAGNESFHGELDEIAIYKRLLTADETAFHFNEGDGTSWKKILKASTPSTCKAIICCDP